MAPLFTRIKMTYLLIFLKNTTRVGIGDSSTHRLSKAHREKERDDVVRAVHTAADLWGLVFPPDESLGG